VAEGSGPKRAMIVRPGMMTAIVVYIVLVVVMGVTLRFGFAITAAVALLPPLLIAAPTIAALGRKARPQEHDTYETTGATTRIRMTAVGDFESVKNQIKTNIDTEKRFQLVNEASESLTIRAGVGPFTWGEEIQIALSRVSNGTVLEAECRHYRQPTAIVDFGQSRRDLKRLLKGVQYTAETQRR
jgi:hypothetical protein